MIIISGFLWIIVIDDRYEKGKKKILFCKSINFYVTFLSTKVDKVCVFVFNDILMIYKIIFNIID